MPHGYSQRRTSTGVLGSASPSASTGLTTANFVIEGVLLSWLTCADVFFRQKCDTFSRSNQAVFELSTRFLQPAQEANGLSGQAKSDKNKLLFLELTQGM
jgi:hypothetical protein